MKVIRKQSGYATVFIVIFFAAIALSVFSLYDIGWVASERIRLQNTADNTAYSTVNMQTRDLNMIAITNRAMIANQVAIGQYVGLVSWASEVNEFSQNLETLGDFIRFVPYVGVLIERITEVLAEATSTMLSVIESGEVFITAQDAITLALSELQKANHLFTLGASQSVYSDILERNDPDVSTSALVSGANVASFMEAWGSEIKEFDSSDVAERNRGGDSRTTQRFTEFANLVNDSRDRFTADRSYRVVPRVNTGIYSFWADKNGGSDFVPVSINGGGGIQWNWTAADTFSFYQKIDLWFTSFTIETPLGWGAAHALHRDHETNNYYYRNHRNKRRDNFDESNWDKVSYQSNDRDRWWGGAWENGNAAGMLRYPSILGSGDSYEGNNLRSTAGLRDFHDFKSDEKTDSMPAFNLFLSKGEQNMKTQKILDEQSATYNRSDRFSVESSGGIPTDKLYASASAQSFFSRPDETTYGTRDHSWNIEWGRNDGLHEHGNLYNPFWQTRLVDESSSILSALVASGAL
ncbi:TadE/TadG family type IV pilus assembly protein [Gilvimarinus agarilyticus]|uniref:TadE/TadG family type IV pilus assembly protein n=1 Tax=Gilvimarinus agarilyticus TaxID=679259 RepID=UPI00059FAD36|nr:Tad domain-containing protein [Gilvimarinus agarilyticus]